MCNYNDKIKYSILLTKVETFLFLSWETLQERIAFELNPVS